jgi:hypothetical protein
LISSVFATIFPVPANPAAVFFSVFIKPGEENTPYNTGKTTLPSQGNFVKENPRSSPIRKAGSFQMESLKKPAVSATLLTCKIIILENLWAFSQRQYSLLKNAWLKRGRKSAPACRLC